MKVKYIFNTFLNVNVEERVFLKLSFLMTTFLAYFIMLGPSISWSWNSDSSILGVFRDELVLKITWPREIDNPSLEPPTIEKTFLHMNMKTNHWQKQLSNICSHYKHHWIKFEVFLSIQKITYTFLKFQKFKFHIRKNSN